MFAARFSAVFLGLVCVAGVAAAQADSAKSGTPHRAPPSKAAMIRSALSAAPAHIAKAASVMGPGADGKMVELQHGTNGWTCLPDDPTTPGHDPMCLDEQGMKWGSSWMNHDAKPANTAPGIGYMLQGGSDISATDPWQKTTTHFVASPPHWMLLWPVDSTSSGLSARPKKTGTWIMWAGTPYAHLMINQKP